MSIPDHIYRQLQTDAETIAELQEALTEVSAECEELEGILATIEAIHESDINDMEAELAVSALDKVAVVEEIASWLHSLIGDDAMFAFRAKFIGEGEVSS